MGFEPRFGLQLHAAVGSNADAGMLLTKCCGWYLKPPCLAFGGLDDSIDTHP